VCDYADDRYASCPLIWALRPMSVVTPHNDRDREPPGRSICDLPRFCLLSIAPEAFAKKKPQTGVAGA
jgi:hypothetical protein